MGALVGCEFSSCGGIYDDKVALKRADLEGIETLLMWLLWPTE